MTGAFHVPRPPVSAEPMRIDLGDLKPGMTLAADLLERRARGKGIELQLEPVGGGTDRVLGDRLRLRQLVTCSTTSPSSPSRAASR